MQLKPGLWGTQGTRFWALFKPASSLHPLLLFWWGKGQRLITASWGQGSGLPSSPPLMLQVDGSHYCWGGEFSGPHQVFSDVVPAGGLPHHCPLASSTELGRCSCLVDCAGESLHAQMASDAPREGDLTTMGKGRLCPKASRTQ